MGAAAVYRLNVDLEVKSLCRVNTDPLLILLTPLHIFVWACNSADIALGINHWARGGDLGRVAADQVQMLVRFVPNGGAPDDRRNPVVPPLGRFSSNVV